MVYCLFVLVVFLCVVFCCFFVLVHSAGDNVGDNAGNAAGNNVGDHVGNNPQSDRDALQHALKLLILKQLPVPMPRQVYLWVLLRSFCGVFSRPVFQYPFGRDFDAKMEAF